MNSTPQGIAIGHVALDFENSFELIALSNPPNEDLYSLIESLLIAKYYHFTYLADVALLLLQDYERALV